MNIELQHQLCAKYPSIFREVCGEPSQTCMAFGIECGNGWHELIDLLCDSITHQVESANRLYPQLRFAVVAAQVKEKYGGLRFYVDYVYDHELLQDADAMKRINKEIDTITGMIRMVERMSFRTCETCGGKCKPDLQSIYPRAECEACDVLRRQAEDDQLGETHNEQ